MQSTSFPYVKIGSVPRDFLHTFHIFQVSDENMYEYFSDYSYISNDDDDDDDNQFNCHLLK
jgi:hypothetical protein